MRGRATPPHPGIYRALALRSDEGLTLETSAFIISVRWPIYIINSVDKLNFCKLEMDTFFQVTLYKDMSYLRLNVL